MNAYSAVAAPRHTSARAGALAAAGAFLPNIAARLVAAYRRQHTMRLLSGLDDAALKDIGVTRGEIDGIERDPRYSAKFPGF